MPFLQDLFAMLKAASRPEVNFDNRIATHRYVVHRAIAHDAKAISSAEEIVSLAADDLPSRLTRLVSKSSPLTFDPAKLPHDGKSNGMIRNRQGCGHAHATIRRVHPEVQVLDGFADDLNRQARDDDLAVFSIHADS
jgi:hypothetical protein